MGTPPGRAHPRIPDGYTLTELLHVGPNAIVYRARQETTPRTVVMKELRGERPAPLRLARLENEYQLARTHGQAGVVRALELIRVGRSLCIAFEDVGGVSLASMLDGGPLEVDRALAIAESTAHQLAGLHAQGIIHRDITPANLLWVAATEDVQVIDLGIATRRPAHIPLSRPPAQLEGSLRWIAPEQTGRMNRAVDARSDLYGLGATLYTLLTGRPPFDEDDLLELIHAHIARLAPAPSSVRAGLPPMVDRLLLTLLNKSPDQRYQSAAGLADDLATLRRRLAMNDRSVFPLGESDVATTLRPASRLVGRAEELTQVLAAFARASAGAAELLLVRGASGIGKSVLVHEIHQPITAARGVFLSGKFDQINRGAALGAFAPVLAQLSRTVLSEPAPVAEPWIRQIRAAVGPSASLFRELCPDSVDLLGEGGPQDTLEPMSGPEAQHRVHRAFIDLLACVADENRPVVLFLDDLQWADPASLRLIEALLTSGDLSHMLVVGAYRDNEVPAGHPLLSVPPRLRRAGVQVDEVAPGPLALRHVTELVADILHHPPGSVAELAELVHARTAGNPFFVFQFLLAGQESGGLGFSPWERAWVWTLDTLEKVGSTHNVIDLLVGRLEVLPPDARRTLAAAACVGNVFTVGLLAGVTGLDRTDIAGHLLGAVELGLLQPLDLEPLDSASVVGPAPTAAGTCRFIHDRVQQAALVSSSDQAGLHRAIGRVLLDQPGEPDLFVVAGHLQRAGPELDDPHEVQRWAELLTHATRRALDTAAAESAHGFAQAALALLDASSWRQRPQATFDLHLLAATSATLSGHFAQADALHAVLGLRSRGAEDDVAAGMERLDQFLLQGRHAEGVAVGIRCLQALGVTLPLTDEAAEEATEALHVHIASLLKGRAVADLLALPEATDPRVQQAVRLLYGLFLCAYLSGQGALALLSFAQTTALSIEHGSCPLSAYGYVGYGMVLTISERDFSLGRQFGELGVALSERFDDTATACKTNFLFAADVQDWTAPILAGQRFFERALELAIQSGDWVTVGYVAMQSGSDQLTAGRSLDALSGWLEGQLAFLRRKGNDDAYEITRAGVYNPILHLQGRTGSWDGIDAFDTADFSVSAYEQRHEGQGFHLAWSTASRLRAAWLVQDRTAYARVAPQVSTIETFVPSHSKVPEAAMFAALMRVALAEDVPTEADGHLAEARRLLARLQKWSEACPENIAARARLVEAELARYEGEFGKSVALYEAAQAAARQAGCPNVEAVATEAHGRMWLARGRQGLANELLREAAWLYKRWGATAKVAALSESLPDAFAAHSAVALSTLQPETTRVRLDEALDVRALVQASEAITSEVERIPLLRRLLHTVAAQSGAQRATVVVEDDAGWKVAASAGIQGFKVHGQALESASAERLVPRRLVRMVLRSQKPVRIADALTDATVGNDPYVRAAGVRSLLCVPLRGQGRLRGALLLEHLATPDAFRPRHAAVLEHLSTQIAIALANATLFEALAASREGLEARVAARTRELREALERLESAQAEVVRNARLASLGTLVSGVAHELNTPLGVALTARDILEDALDSIEDDPASLARARHAARLMGANVGRAAQLIQSFKGFAVDQTHDSDRRIVVHDYLQTVFESLGPMMHQHRLVLDYTDSSYGAEMVCEPGRLGQLLTNLIENAGLHGYDGTGGTVRVRLSRAPGGIALRVEDDGRGMSEDVRTQCLTPFFTTRRGHGGSGIGLAMVHTIVVEDLSGRLAVESSPGSGTAIQIWLPAGSASA